MIKHSALLSAFVAVLVFTLLYCISPGELETACAGIERQGQSAVESVLAVLHGKELKLPEIRLAQAKPVTRDFKPDPFRPYGSRPPTAAGRFWSWFHRPEPLWFLSAAVPVLWLRRRARLKRYRYAAEQKMAVNLSRAVRQM